jgi:hypothetical protein
MYSLSAFIFVWQQETIEQFGFSFPVKYPVTSINVLVQVISSVNRPCNYYFGLANDASSNVILSGLSSICHAQEPRIDPV